MGFGEAIKRGFAGWSTWSGRATRSEYWWWVLFLFLVSLIPYIGVFATMDWSTNDDGTLNGGGGSAIWWVLLAIVGLALILPTIAVSVRRLHDTGRSGWWYWVQLIPCGIGLIWWIILTVQPSQPGQNQYG
ncbi:MAG TPA: DUF805 domain-containing protein [Actinomycetes bacterium]|nr:DUF805 domain-containing protein [Actinomycetes bacterium]